MRTVLPIALAVAVMACHNAAHPGPSPFRKNGSYGFRISLIGRDPVDGSFTIAPDTVTVEAGGQDCRSDAHRVTSRQVHYFNCFPPGGLDSFVVTIDSDQPHSSNWSMVQTVVKTRTICVRYTLNARGQRVCAETRTENYFENSRLGGRLRVVAADTTGVSGRRE